MKSKREIIELPKILPVQSKREIIELPKILPVRSRFRNTMAKYIIRRNSRCTSCGLCAELCPYEVHPRYDIYSRPIRPKDHKCLGFSCRENDFFCVKQCPEKALTLSLNQSAPGNPGRLSLDCGDVVRALGDGRNRRPADGQFGI
jgi:ferredoxin